MIIYIDIDETICGTPSSRDYSLAIPLLDRIKKFNKLYDDGHIIIYWTARGTVSKIDFSELTAKQLKEWGVKFDEIKFGKPAFDILIDDKALNSLYHLDDLSKLVTEKSLVRK